MKLRLVSRLMVISLVVVVGIIIIIRQRSVAGDAPHHAVAKPTVLAGRVSDTGSGGLVLRGPKNLSEFV